MASGHDLVIGGSGMLAGLCLRLAKEGNTVSVVARKPEPIQALTNQAAPGHIIPVLADYRESGAFEQALLGSAERHGPPNRIFCWVHDDVAPDAALQAAGHANGPFWHVLGSAAGHPGEPKILSGWRVRFCDRRPRLDYRQIVLGFVLEKDASRWLTDAEISDGVYNAAQSGDALRIVGIVDPWSRRP
jgi:hypothetical protein